MVAQDSITALKRFGLGPKPGEAAEIDGRARDWLVGQCDTPDAAFITDRRAQDTASLQREFRDYRIMRKDIRDNGFKAFKAYGLADKASMAGEAAMGDAMSMSPSMSPPVAGDDAGMMAGKPSEGTMLKKLRALNPARNAFFREARMRLTHAIDTPAPFVERLVVFWSDHFCISAKKSGRVRVVAGAYEREAIRPFVLGRFGDMLRASVEHPAMLLYLDNTRSIGPNSPVGLRRGKGLNENHAREILELHTLGVDGGYTQDDVINFAKILTGWSVYGPNHPDSGLFDFKPDRHEPGSFVLLNKRYGQRGMAKGEAALDDLARHPATARHIAAKLVRYFGPGEPIPAVEDRLAKRFLETDGDLAEVSRALVLSDELWLAPAEKLLSPYEMLVASGRALGWAPNGQKIIRMLNVLGQPLWSPPSPAGWPDEAGTWLAADALMERLDWAESIAAKTGGRRDVVALGDELFGEAMSEYTRQALSRAESRTQALAILLMSPEFQRR